MLSCASREQFNLKDKETLRLNKIGADYGTAIRVKFTCFLVSCRFNCNMLASHPSSPSVKKIAVVGPECTGKTDLSKYLASSFKTEWVPEYARAYINKLNRPYDQNDLTKIAHGQLRVEDEWMQTANRVLICDTNLIVLKVWSEEKFGNTDPEIITTMNNRHYDLLLLTNIDIPWEEDPQREHPDKREYFWNIYKKEAVASKIPTVEISGDRETRRRTAVEAIQNILV